MEVDDFPPAHSPLAGFPPPATSPHGRLKSPVFLSPHSPVSPTSPHHPHFQYLQRHNLALQHAHQAKMAYYNANPHLLQQHAANPHLAYLKANPHLMLRPQKTQLRTKINPRKPFYDIFIPSDEWPPCDPFLMKIVHGLTDSATVAPSKYARIGSERVKPRKQRGRKRG